MNVYYTIIPSTGGRNGTCWVTVPATGTVATATNFGGYLVPASDTEISTGTLATYEAGWITSGPLDYTSIIQPFAFPFIGSMGQWDGTYFYVNLGWNGVPYNLSCLAIIWAQIP